mmetsp:Transcript_4692/g.13588  ORF Transcript_4692/g.13588 Transcript_4692/m.13588 type:complete len:80 (-) Transcript_4692:700-939(-)
MVALLWPPMLGMPPPCIPSINESRGSESPRRSEPNWDPIRRPFRHEKNDKKIEKVYGAMEMILWNELPKWVNKMDPSFR